MLKRVLKSYKERNIEKDVLLIYGKGRKKPIGSKAKALFEDANASVWYDDKKKKKTKKRSQKGGKMCDACLVT